MEQSKVELICILCPLSCTLEVSTEPSGKLKVEGAQCTRGIEYAKEEVYNPVRHVMTVVRVKHGDMPTVSVITAKPIPKKCIPEVMKVTADLEVEAPIELGQIIVPDVCGTSLIATRRIRRVEENR